MKAISLFSILLLTLACGQNGKDKTVSAADEKEAGLCKISGRSVACAMTGDQNGIDLLEAMIDVPVKIDGSDITFLADKSSKAGGRRISCDIGVKQGEVYRFALRDDRLLVTTAAGSYEMSRTADGEGLQGSWNWSGYIEGGRHVMRQLTVLGSARLILRESCEL